MSHHTPISREAEDRFIQANGLTLHYREWGHHRAPPLLLLHAAGCHAHWWDDTARQFAGRYRVIAPDLRGHGDSSRPASADYTFDAYASDIAALVNALALRDVRLVGHSLGGYVGLVYASQQPTQLVSLAIVDMLCELDHATLERVHEASRKPSPTFVSREDAEARFRLQPPETVAPADVLARLTRAAVTEMPDGRFGFKFDRRAMGHPPVCAWDLAPSVTCPTLVARGDCSTLMSREHAERLAASLPRGTVREVAGAYHHVMLDAPRAFAAMLDEFLHRTSLSSHSPA